MPANSFALSELADFEKNFKPAATSAKPAAGTQPAGESAAGATDQTAADGDTLADENTDAGDSSTAAVVSSDETVESSAADTTTADASDASETVGEPADANTDLQPPKAKGRAQARIEDLVASNKALKASLDYLQNQVLAKLPQQQPQTEVPPAGAQPVVAADEAAPTLENCGYDTDKWTRAMHAWTEKRIAAGVTQAVQTVQQNQTEASRKAAFDTRMAAFGATTPDLQVVLGNPALPRLSKDAAALVVDSEVGPQILYHLGKNPEKAARIARQSPVQQAAAIGRLEAELATKTTAQKKQTTSNITRAPNPPTPTSGRGNTPSVDPAKLSTKEWIEWDRKQTEARQRARRA